MGNECGCNDRNRKVSMKPFRWSALSMIVILNVLVNPVFAAPNLSGHAQKTVTASGVVVPAQVSELGFLISGIAREIPVKEGEAIKAGQTLSVLDAPDLEFAVTEAQANLRAAQVYADLQKYRRVKN